MIMAGACHLVQTRTLRDELAPGLRLGALLGALLLLQLRNKLVAHHRAPSRERPAGQQRAERRCVCFSRPRATTRAQRGAEAPSRCRRGGLSA